MHTSKYYGCGKRAGQWGGGEDIDLLEKLKTSTDEGEGAAAEDEKGEREGSGS
jgi:hypothetical protein